MSIHPDFADFCCELLSGLGRIAKRRMFGGWGLSLEGVTVALVADLGDGAKLWLKADDESRRRFEAAGCARFTYGMRQGDTTVQRSMNYYQAPDEAMDAPEAMAPWARMALASALQARAAQPAARPRRNTAPRQAGGRESTRARPARRRPQG